MNRQGVARRVRKAPSPALDGAALNRGHFDPGKEAAGHHEVNRRMGMTLVHPDYESWGKVTVAIGLLVGSLVGAAFAAWTVLPLSPSESDGVDVVG